MIRNADDFRRRARERLHRLGELADADFLVGANVVDLADGCGLIHDADQRADDVADIGEAARLRAVAVHGDRPAQERLLHEGRDDHAILPGLPRAHGVEEANHHGRQMLLTPVGQGEELIERLRAGIAPAAFCRRPQHQRTVFLERHLFAQAVHLGSRGQEHFFLFLVGLGEDDLGAVHVGFDGAHRAFDDQLHADGGRQVQDNVAAIDEFCHHPGLVHAVNRVVEARMSLEVGDVINAR